MWYGWKPTPTTAKSIQRRKTKFVQLALATQLPGMTDHRFESEFNSKIRLSDDRWFLTKLTTVWGSRKVNAHSTCVLSTYCHLFAMLKHSRLSTHSNFISDCIFACSNASLLFFSFGSSSRFS